MPNPNEGKMIEYMKYYAEIFQKIADNLGHTPQLEPIAYKKIIDCFYNHVDVDECVEKILPLASDAGSIDEEDGLEEVPIDETNESVDPFDTDAIDDVHSHKHHISSANNKMRLKMTAKSWRAIGKKAGWIK